MRRLLKTSVVVSLVILWVGWVCGQECPQADFTGDCQVDYTDLAVVAGIWLGAGGMDMTGFGTLSAGWGRRVGPVLINEFMASNGSTEPLGQGDLLDADGRSSDWMELNNLASVRVDLSGWFLTDDANDLTKWEFPLGVEIDGGAYLIVFASGQDRTVSGQELHTNFRLDADGEYLALVRPDGKTVVHEYADYEFSPGKFGYLPQERDISYGIYDGGNRYFSIASPGQENNAAYEGVVADTKFSIDRGFYDAPFSVEITTATPGAAIRYTTDGSEPTERHGRIYDGPVDISSTTLLRATAYKPGWMSTNVDTHTYILNAGAAIRSLPVISLAGDEHSTFYMPDGICAIRGGTYTGNYVSWVPVEAGDYNNPMGHGPAYERPVSVELIAPSDNSGFQEDCGIRVSGSAYSRSRYRTNSKFSFRLYFRNAYGDNWLDYPIIPTAPVERFQHVVLRAGQTDKVNPFIKDELGRRLQRDMSGLACNGTFANLFVNAQYKGYYNPCERIDEEMMQTQFASEMDWDVVGNWRPEDDDYAWTSGDPVDRAFRFDARDGDMGAFEELLRYALDNDLGDPQHYAWVADRLDIEQFVDYLILEGYCHHDDWPHNNWAAARERSTGPLGKWRFFVWDIEHSFKSSTLDNKFKTPGSSGGIQPIGILYEQLRGNRRFIQTFTDRVQKHLFNDGALTESNVIGRFEELRQVMSGVLPNMNTFIRDTWAGQRPVRVLDSLKSKGLFTFEAPQFYINGVYRHGGDSFAGDVLTFANPHGAGTVYYTVDGSDPRLPAEVETRRITLVAEDADKRVHVPHGPDPGADGFLLREYWTGINGTSISSLTSSADYPDNPTGSELISTFEAPTNWNDYYGTRIRGYLIPTVSDEYYFWIASDDNGQLRLSTDENVQNSSLIASVPGWARSRQWDKYASQKSAAISLVAGRRYYIEALQKDGAGGDNLAVAWEGAGFGRRLIDGAYLSSVLTDWTAREYDDSTWRAGTGGVGYETKPEMLVNYVGLFGMDVYSDMFDRNSACYIRIPFDLVHTDIRQLILRMKYDDGFVTWLNGQEVARRNFSGPVTWNSAADRHHPDEEAIRFAEIDISAYIGVLRTGPNVLAIQGLNLTADNSDFLISAELVADEVIDVGGGIADTAIEYTGGIVLQESVHLRVRTLDQATWSGLNEAVFQLP